MTVHESSEGMRAGSPARLLSLALLSLVLMVVVSGVALTYRGQAAMEKSDSAFDSGQLRESLAHARRAALSYVPGAGHVKASYARLEAIARGAESEADFETARVAWDTLRLVHVQTAYPGRPASELEQRANDGLKRVAASRVSD